MPFEKVPMGLAKVFGQGRVKPQEGLTYGTVTTDLNPIDSLPSDRQIVHTLFRQSQSGEDREWRQ